MLLKVIGCWAPFPRAGEACSGYLLSAGNTHLLLDCGHAVASHLPRHLPPEHLAAVFISHFHPDHYADLYAIRHIIRAAMQKGVRKNPLPVYMPVQPEQDYLAFQAMNELAIMPLAQRTAFTLGDIKLKVFPVSHSLPGFGVIAENQGRSMAYTADACLDAELENEVHGVNLLLSECSLQMADREVAAQLGHMTTEDAGNLARISKAGCLVATHFWPDYDVKVLKQEIARAFPGKLVMAHHDLAIEI